MAIRLPAVLSFARHMQTSYGLMFDIDGDTGERRPTMVKVMGMMGTQNVNENSAAGKEAAASSKDRAVCNPQFVEVAITRPDSCGLVVESSIRGIPFSLRPCKCMPAKDSTADTASTFKTSYGAYITKAKEKDAFYLLGLRYARNILNGRWLWRNREEACEVDVTINMQEEGIFTVNALDVPMDNFDNPSELEQKIARRLSDGWCGDRTKLITFSGSINFGVDGAFVVYPSEERVETREAGYGRVLCAVNDHLFDQPEHSPIIKGQGAIHDTKIANAIRTIDTWYPTYKDVREAIPVEPNGASIEHQKFFRQGDASAFQLIKTIDTMEPDTDNGLFTLACLIRGGVFSSKGE